MFSLIRVTCRKSSQGSSLISFWLLLKIPSSERLPLSTHMEYPLPFARSASLRDTWNHLPSPITLPSLLEYKGWEGRAGPLHRPAQGRAQGGGGVKTVGQKNMWLQHL